MLFLSAVIEIRSDATLAEAVKLLSRHKILSAPVVDVDAPEDASWIDRYIGIVEFAGIVVWILHQVCTLYIKSQLNMFLPIHNYGIDEHMLPLKAGKRLKASFQMDQHLINCYKDSGILVAHCPPFQ